jgi:hypothetical protein
MARANVSSEIRNDAAVNGIMTTSESLVFCICAVDGCNWFDPCLESVMLRTPMEMLYVIASM